MIVVYLDCLPMTLRHTCYSFDRDHRDDMPLGSTASPFLDVATLTTILEQLRDEPDLAPLAQDGRIVVRLEYAGDLLREPTLLTEALTDELEAIASYAPLRLPHVIPLLRLLPQVFPSVPVVVFSETAFFSELHAREREYATSDAVRRVTRPRSGLYGILHEAACDDALEFWHAQGHSAPARTISICLDVRPELVAATGRHPLFVTTGSTPLDGLPGETSCGEIDPSIPLYLSRDHRLGPEEIDRILTTESGIAGLVGRRITIGDLLERNGRWVRPARELFLYRLMLAFGKAIAALGGVDIVVFSGRYVGSAPALIRWFERSELLSSDDTPAIVWRRQTKPVGAIAAERAAAMEVRV